MKRTSLNFATKPLIINEIRDGVTHRALAEKYGVSRSQITALNSGRVQSEVWRVSSVAGFKSTLKYRKPKPRYLHLENELLDWFCAMRAKKLIVTGEALRAKALGIRDELMS
jgi:hypothetical protein